MSLPTNLKDAILNTSSNTHRRFNIKSHVDNSVVAANVYLEEITDYTQQGDEVSASQLNESNALVNGLTLDVKSIQIINGPMPTTGGVEDRLYFSTE